MTDIKPPESVHNVDRSPQDGSPKISGSPGASIAQVFLGEKGKERLIWLLLGINLLLTITSIYMYRDDATEQRLHQYEVQQLRVQTDLNQELQKIILSRECK